MATCLGSSTHCLRAQEFQLYFLLAHALNQGPCMRGISGLPLILLMLEGQMLDLDHRARPRCRCRSPLAWCRWLGTAGAVACALPRAERSPGLRRE